MRLKASQPSSASCSSQPSSPPDSINRPAHAFGYSILGRVIVTRRFGSGGECGAMAPRRVGPSLSMAGLSIWCRRIESWGRDDVPGVLGTAGVDGEPGQAGDEAVRNAKHSWSASAAFPLTSTHDRIFGLHRSGVSRQPAALHDPPLDWLVSVVFLALVVGGCGDGVGGDRRQLAIDIGESNSNPCGLRAKYGDSRSRPGPQSVCPTTG